MRPHILRGPPKYTGKLNGMSLKIVYLLLVGVAKWESGSVNTKSTFVCVCVYE